MLTLVYVLGLLGMTVSATALAVRRARLRRQLRAGVKPVQDREMVTVVGEVRAIGPLEAPLAGTPCVAYRTLIKLHQISRYLPEDDLIRVSQALVPFELVTGKGVVRVEGPAFELLHHEPVPIIPRPLKRQRALLAAHDLADEPLDRTSFEEMRIAPGDRISVHGMAIVELDPSGPLAGYRHVPTATRLVSRDDQPILIDRVR